MQKKGQVCKGLSFPPGCNLLQPTAGSVAESAWRLFLNYDGAGAAVVGTSVAATSDNTPLVGAYAFIDAASTLRVLLTGKGEQGSVDTSALLSVTWPAGTPAGGSVIAALYGLSAASPVLAHIGNVTVACGEGAPPTPVTLPSWSMTLIVLPYECTPAAA